MQKISNSEELLVAIQELESQKATQQDALKAELHSTFDNLNPTKLIRLGIQEISTSKEIGGDLLNAGIGFTAGYLSKVIYEASSNSPIKKLIGTGILLGVTNLVSKNPEITKTIARSVIQLFSRTMESYNQKVAENHPTPAGNGKSA